MRTVRKSATYTVAVHFSQCVPYCYSWLQSILYTANMESVDGTTPSTVSHTACNRRLSASPCRLSRAHASDERVHAAGGQCVHAGCRSCVGKRCIVSALTRCVANINRRILRLSSVGLLPLAKNALHSPTSILLWSIGNG